uniref:Uncharacterized protein n=1 Tax=Oryza rufipogon TaxID=4529 RepID=A0A0E0QIW9_ORYRU
MAARGCGHLRLDTAAIKSLPSAMAARGCGRRGRWRRDLLTHIISHPQALAQCELTLNAMGLNSAPGIGGARNLLQLPDIILNARNLLTGNKTALFAIPWLVRLTSPSIPSTFSPIC